MGIKLHIYSGSTPAEGWMVEADLNTLLNAINSIKIPVCPPVLPNRLSVIQRGVCLPVFGSDEDVAIAEGTVFLLIPKMLSGKNLIYVIAAVDTQGTGATTIDVGLRRVRAGVTQEMLSTLITISDSERFASDGIIDPDYQDVLEGDIIFPDVDAISTGAKGLSITLVFK